MVHIHEMVSKARHPLEYLEHLSREDRSVNARDDDVRVGSVPGLLLMLMVVAVTVVMVVVVVRGGCCCW